MLCNFHHLFINITLEIWEKWFHLCQQIGAFSEAVKNLAGNTRNSQRKYALTWVGGGNLECLPWVSAPPRVFTYFGGNLIFKAKTLSLLWNPKLRVDIWGNYKITIVPKSNYWRNKSFLLLRITHTGLESELKDDNNKDHKNGWDLVLHLTWV